MHCSETLGGIVPRFQCDAGGSSSGGSGAPAPTSETAVLVKQAQQLNSEGKQDEAVTTYRKGLEISPNDVDAHLGMGSVLDLKGDYAEARRHLAKAIEVASAAHAKERAWRTIRDRCLVPKSVTNHLDEYSCRCRQ